jgi:hypothetical protein
MASNGGDTASTGDLAAGDNAAILTSQGAGADDDHAGAGQSSTVSGEIAVAGSTAQASDGASAATVAAAEDGTIVTSQGAGAEGDAHAGQNTLIGTVGVDQDDNVIAVVTAERAVIASTASDGEGNTATTVAAGSDVAMVSYQHVDGDPEESASATQSALIVGGADAKAFAGTGAESEDGNSAETHDIAEAGTGILIIATSQGSIAEDDLAAAGQAGNPQFGPRSIVAGSAFAAASSSSESEDGDRASTKDVAWNGGGIVTTQGAIAGEGSFGPIEIEGAAAAQISDITAFDGAVAESEASNRHADEGAADTKAVIHGKGGIETIQGRCR